jgi:hypothetical protein
LLTVEANPYLLTAIGVAGTLFGAVVAAVTQAVTSRAMRASQAQMLDMQTRHATEQLLREQRREVYAQFIRALDEASGLGGRREHPEAHADGAPTKEQMDQANRKLLKLQRDLDLLATEKVERTAHAVQEYVVTEMYGHDIAGQPLLPRSKGATFAALLSYMREELGVTGGRTVDPETGAYRAREPL